MRGIIVVKADRCVGCLSCELACALEHSESADLTGAVRESPRARSRISVLKGEQLAVPMQCRQCEDAPCMVICPVKALYREDGVSGPVLLNEETCIGCKMCVLACPFGLVDVDVERKKAVKCDQCAERVQGGQLPACVAACPTEALEFKALDEVVSEKRRAYLVEFEKG